MVEIRTERVDDNGNERDRKSRVGEPRYILKIGVLAVILIFDFGFLRGNMGYPDWNVW